jgi:hypothetical protein
MRTPSSPARLCTIVQNCALNQLFPPPSSHAAQPLLPGAMPSLAASGLPREPVSPARVGMPLVPPRAKPCQTTPTRAITIKNAKRTQETIWHTSPPPSPACVKFPNEPTALVTPSSPRPLRLCSEPSTAPAKRTHQGQRTMDNGHPTISLDASAPHPYIPPP